MVDSKGFAVYTQSRVGKERRVFDFYKFRTMIKGAEKETGPVWAKRNDERVTKVGRYLRRTNLDELPQLWNVLLGDMSLIGPRPERPFFVNKFKEEIKGYEDRHKVRPGMTGWAQVNGYFGNTSLKKRVECDLYYIDHQSVLLDLRIMLRTIKKFLYRIFFS